MKKNYIIIVCTILAALIVGCSDNNGTVQQTEPVSERVEEKSIEEKIIEEKLRIREILDGYVYTYKNDSYSGDGDLSDFYKHVTLTREKISNILVDLEGQDWGNTGDVEFDKSCKDLKENAIKTYSTFLNSIDQFLIALNSNSERKINKAMDDMKNSGTLIEELILKTDNFTSVK